MPSSLTKEGDAHERDGSFDIIACIFAALSYIDNHKKTQAQQPAFQEFTA